MTITIKYLQQYIKCKDHNPEMREHYFLKLVEEVGELAKAIRNGSKMENNQIKGTIDEELWDILYYVLAIANIYDVELEKIIPLKEDINNTKYHTGINFGDDLKS